ncbi:MAG: hypothetical protein DHS20C11_28990 [Lysobacteraceae bacterium]|nr:MAG: hypothetical protein DHS20C11_28990 [Xanthomonadaceae bacterium]
MSRFSAVGKSSRGAAPLPDLRSSVEIRAWLSDLPLADPVAAATRLHDLVSAIGTHKASAMTRLKLLELISPTLDASLSTMQQTLVGAPVPLPSRLAEIADFCLEVESGLASAYAAVSAGWVSKGRIPWFRRKAGALALHRSAFYRGRALETSWLSYRCPPEGVWRALHLDYAIAVSSGVAEASLKVVGNSSAHSIHEVWVRSVLMAAVDPNRHCQSELLALAALFQAEMGRIEVAMSRSEGTQWCVRLTGDFQPIHCGDDPRKVGDLYLDIGKLVAWLQTLRGDRTVITRLGKPVVLTERNIQDVVTALSEPSERSFRRINGGYTLYSVFGMRGIHYNVGNSMEFMSYLPSQVSVSSAPAPANWTTDRQSSDEVYHNPIVARATTINQSRGGYRLLFEPRCGIRARVGEVMGLTLPYEDEESPIWLVCCIRWVQCRDDGKLEIGVSLLARQAEAIALAVAVPGNDGQMQRALLLKDYRPDSDATHIAVEQTNLRVGSKVEFLGMLPGARVPGVVEECVDRTDCFAVYAVRELKARRHAA